MKGFFRLLLHSLRRVRTLVIAMGIVLAGFQVFLTLLARSVRASSAFDQINALIPDFARELVGPAFMSFGGIVCLGYFHPVVMSSLIALAIALGTMPTSEIESGFMDLILTRPLARYWVVTRSIILIVICGLLLLGAMMGGTWIGLKTLAPPDAEWPSAKMVVSLAVNLGFLVVCWGGVALAIGCASRRRGAAGGVTGMLALIAFLADYLGRAWKPAEPAAWLSPFHYYSPFDLLTGGSLPGKSLLILGGIAVAGFALAYGFFVKRDISH